MANCPVDTTKMMPADSIVGEDLEDTNLLKKMAEVATAFISAQKWCARVDSLYLAYGVGGVVAIFLVQITPRFENVDSCLWVIVGDLPPAYIVVDEEPTAASALQGYLDEMTNWVEAVEQGQNVEDLIPVNVPPTPEYAGQLRSRLEFLRSKILPLLGVEEQQGTS